MHRLPLCSKDIATPNEVNFEILGINARWDLKVYMIVTSLFLRVYENVF